VVLRGKVQVKFGIGIYMISRKHLTEKDLKLDRNIDGREPCEKAPMRLPMVICTTEDLYTLLQASRTRPHMLQGQLTLAISGFNEKERLSYQRKLNAYAHTCGCVEGGIFALAAFAIVIAYSIFSLLQGAWSDLITTWLSGFILILLCAGIGKLTGLFVARLRFRRACIQMIRSLRAESLIALSTEKEIWP
jgi:hypothetical protein